MLVDKHKDWLASTLKKHMQKIHAHATISKPTILTYQRLVSLSYRKFVHLKYAKYKILSICARASLPAGFHNKVYAIHPWLLLNFVHNTRLHLIRTHCKGKTLTVVSPQTFKYNKISRCSKTWF